MMLREVFFGYQTLPVKKKNFSFPRDSGTNDKGDGTLAKFVWGCAFEIFFFIWL